MYGGYQSKSSLIYTIDKMKVEHHEEMEMMRKKLLEEKEKVKELEDRFGVTKKRKWDTRHRAWWMMWLYSSDADAYDYLMKTLHKTLLWGGHSAPDHSGIKLALKEKRRELKNVPWNERNHCNEFINLHGMKLSSDTHWWNHGNPVVLLLCSTRMLSRRAVFSQTKAYLVSCCEENNIPYNKSWPKKVFIKKIMEYTRPSDEYSIEDLKEMIKEKESHLC